MSRPTMLICMGRLLWGSVYRPSVIARRCRYRAVHPINGRLRDELLNETLFVSLAHARCALAAWKLDYNTVRPHSAIGNMPPAVYAKLGDPAMQRGLTGSNDEPTQLIPG